FHHGFGLATGMYTRVVGSMIRVSVVVLIVYGGLLALTYGMFITTPRGFIPSQDMGYLLINVQLPDSASKERADEVMRQVSQITRATPGVRHVSSISGQSFALSASGSNFGSMFVNLKDYPDRRDPELYAERIANALRTQLTKEVFDAQV